MYDVYKCYKINASKGRLVAKQQTANQPGIQPNNQLSFHSLCRIAQMLFNIFATTYSRSHTPSCVSVCPLYKAGHVHKTKESAGIAKTKGKEKSLHTLLLGCCK